MASSRLSPSTANQRVMAWSGIVGIGILLIGQWAIAGFVPPPGPDETQQSIVSNYVENQDSIRIGLIIAVMGATLFLPWSVAIAAQMKRIEGRIPALAWLQVALGACLVIEFYIPTMVWQAAAFRPELDPELTYRFHDFGSILFVGLPWTGALQAVILGVAILQDRNEPTIFPRWLAYLSLWAGFGFLFGALNPLAHDGPIAWSGILAWWLGLSIFGVWILGVTWSLLRFAIPHQQEEEGTE